MQLIVDTRVRERVYSTVLKKRSLLSRLFRLRGSDLSLFHRVDETVWISDSCLRYVFRLDIQPENERIIVRIPFSGLDSVVFQLGVQKIVFTGGIYIHEVSDYSPSMVYPLGRRYSEFAMIDYYLPSLYESLKRESVPLREI